MEPQQSLPSCQIFILTRRQALDESTVIILDNQRSRHPNLPFNMGQHSHIIFPTRMEIHDGFVTKTSGPDWVRIAFVVLLVGVVKDNLNVGSPNVVTVDGHLTTW
jgi:hypothetical protein